MRINEKRDDGHGLRGGKYALKHKDMLELTDEQLHTLYRACAAIRAEETHPVILLPVAGKQID